MILENLFRFLNTGTSDLDKEQQYLELRPVSYLMLADNEKQYALVLNESLLPERIAYDNIEDASYLQNWKGSCVMMGYKFDKSDPSRYKIAIDGFNIYRDVDAYAYVRNWDRLGLKRRLLLMGGSKVFQTKLRLILEREIDREVNDDYLNLYFNSFYFYISYGYNYKPGGDDRIWVDSETTRLNCDPFLASEPSKIGTLDERLHEDYGAGAYDQMYREYSRYEKKEHIAKLSQKRDDIVKAFLANYDAWAHRKYLMQWIDQQFKTAEIFLQEQISKWLPDHR